MKKITEVEIKNKLIKYLSNKGIQVSISQTHELTWYYEPFYSKYIIRLHIEEKYGKYIIQYSVNEYIKGINRRKTTVNDGFCNKVYNNLIHFKGELDKLAEIERDAIDTKTKYCTELEKYYKKLYERVDITTRTVKQNHGIYVGINISCYDGYKQSAAYSIYFDRNKYYLMQKTENVCEVFNVE
jgi:hypothetical protein